MPRSQKSSKTEKSVFPIIPIMITAVGSMVLYFVLISLFALYSLKTGADRSLYLPFTVVLGAISGFVCGFISARIAKVNGMVYGGIGGLIHSLLSSIIIFILNGGVAGNGIFILIAVSVVASALGGISAVNIKKKIKY